MAVNEQIVIGRAFRKLIDEASNKWMKISFWTKASDVEFDDGETAETKFTSFKKYVNEQIANLKQSFQDGVNKIFEKLKGLGFTPKENSPDGICDAIDNIYQTRYDTGSNDGYKKGYAKGYEDRKDDASIEYIYHKHDGNSTTGGGCYTWVDTPAGTTQCTHTYSSRLEEYHGHSPVWVYDFASATHTDCPLKNGHNNAQITLINDMTKVEGYEVVGTNIYLYPKSQYEADPLPSVTHIMESSTGFKGYKLTCGMTEETIVGAKIKWK